MIVFHDGKVGSGLPTTDKFIVKEWDDGYSFAGRIYRLGYRVVSTPDTMTLYSDNFSITVIKEEFIRLEKPFEEYFYLSYLLWVATGIDADELKTLLINCANGDDSSCSRIRELIENNDFECGTIIYGITDRIKGKYSC